MTDSTEEIALGTIELLERRLKRLQYLITGDGDPEAIVQPPTDPRLTHQLTHQPVGVRLSQLERDFERLCVRSKLVQDILQLRRCHFSSPRTAFSTEHRRRIDARYPDSFEPIPPQDIPTLLNTEELRAIVLAYADRFPSITSRLKSVFEISVPPAEASMALVNLRPRIDRFTTIQEQQGEEFLRLQRRTAALLERWYTVFVMGAGDCWAEWHTRITRAERTIRRAEVAKEREQKESG